MNAVPLMPDQEYIWLSDQKWRTRNDAFSEALMGADANACPNAYSPADRITQTDRRGALLPLKG
jgi:hypothetical protein